MKKNAIEGLVVDMMNGYIPRLMEAALNYGGMTRQPGKSGEDRTEGKLVAPRLKHRPDCKTYVSKEQNSEGKYIAWSSGEYGVGYITSPRYVNPQKGKEALMRALIEVLWGLYDADQLTGIVGVINSEPVHSFEQLEQKLNTECLFRESCSFSKGICHCIWRPGQIVTWGKIDGNKFVALNEIIRTNRILSKDLAQMVSDYMGEEIDVEKLVSNIATISRTDMSTANCYGIHLLQFGIGIESGFTDKEELCFNLALNVRHPVIETWRQAHKRLSASNESKPKKNKDSCGSTTKNNVSVKKIEVIPVPKKVKQKKDISSTTSLKTNVIDIEKEEVFDEIFDEELEIEKEFKNSFEDFEEDDEDELIEEEHIYLED